MKNKINIFSDKKINFFLSELFSDYELYFMSLSETQNYIENNNINIIILNNDKRTKPIFVGPNPVPVAACPATVLLEVTNG